MKRSRRPATQGKSLGVRSSQRELLRLTVITGAVALLIDLGAAAHAIDAYRTDGEFCLEIRLSLLGAFFTVYAAYTARGWWRAKHTK
jgi:hypothetical protein